MEKDRGPSDHAGRRIKLCNSARWRRPAGGDGCAMTSANGVLYVLSPSETCTEMLVWCLQLGAKNALRWTQVPRSGNVPSPRVGYATATHGHNWIVHGGRVLLRDGALGDTYAFHFPTAEWARFDRESDTDPRFGHCGSAVDGALVLLHGTRDPHAAAYMRDDAEEEAEDAGECIAVDLATYLVFPEFGAEKDEEDAFDAHRHGHLSTVEERVSGTGARREGDGGGADGDGEEGRKEPDPDVAAFEREGFPKMNAKLLGKLNARGLGQKGGLMGGSLHVPRKGSHAPGDVELVSGTGRIKLHAHADVLAAASPGLKRLMQQRPVAAALARREDLVDRACKAFGGRSAALGQLLLQKSAEDREATVTISRSRGKLSSSSAPIPLLITWSIGQPQLRSKKSAWHSRSKISAHLATLSAKAPAIWMPNISSVLCLRKSAHSPEFPSIILDARAISP